MAANNQLTRGLMIKTTNGNAVRARQLPAVRVEVAGQSAYVLQEVALSALDGDSLRPRRAQQHPQEQSLKTKHINVAALAHCPPNRHQFSSDRWQRKFFQCDDD